MPTAISGRMPVVDLVWESRGRLVRKRFADPYVARRMYARFLRDGRNPHVIDPNNEGDSVMPTATKRKPANKATSKKKQTTPKQPTAKDKLGARVNTEAAKINACLSTKPRTRESIATSAGLKVARVASHLRWLKARKLVVQTDKGFALKQAK